MEVKEGSLTTIAFLTVASMSRQTTLPQRERGEEREKRREREREREWVGESGERGGGGRRTQGPA